MRNLSIDSGITITVVKNKLMKLFFNNPEIHITLYGVKPKKIWDCIPVCIVGVYPNFFRIKEKPIKGYSKFHSIRYADFLSGNLEIDELEI